MKWLYVVLYFTGMLVEMIIRRPYDRQRRKIPKFDQRVTFMERALLAGLSVTMLLISRGVYRLIRHPMYASQLLYCGAQALLLQNWIAGLAGFVAFLPMYTVRVPRKEQMMLDHFGDRYQEYCQRTGRIVPRLHG